MFHERPINLTIITNSIPVRLALCTRSDVREIIYQSRIKIDMASYVSENLETPV